MKNKSYIKGFLEDIVLHLISENNEMYGYEITKKVQELTNGVITVTEGALYPILHKLENENKLTAQFKNASGRMRKYYKLTPEGGKTVTTGSTELADFFAGMQQIFHLKPAAKWAHQNNLASKN